MKLKLNGIGLAVWLGTAVVLLGACGCAGDRYTQSTGEHIDDTATSMRVKSALAADGPYKYPMFEVKTFKGTTQLSGFVDTDIQKGRAGDVAKLVEGVRVVEKDRKSVV